MLSALEESTRAQQQLVGDASHELRTPLTSLRTNVEVLAGGRELPEGERRRLLNDVVEQLDEMTTLVGSSASSRAANTSPARPKTSGSTSSRPTPSSARGGTGPASTSGPSSRRPSSTAFPQSIERAIANLLDNAAKWSPAGGEVEVG
jgi:two-component system sensor histidine kinase MprB